MPIESKGLDLSETGHQMTKGRVQLVNENDAGEDYGAIETNNDNVPDHDLQERYWYVVVNFVFWSLLSDWKIDITIMV